VASEDVIAATEDVLASFAPVDVTFRETRRFPDVVYLAPEPADPYARAASALLLSEVGPQRWTQQAEFRLGGG
jgi:hypothetical protein